VGGQDPAVATDVC